MILKLTILTILQIYIVWFFYANPKTKIILFGLTILKRKGIYFYCVTVNLGCKTIN